MSSVSEEDDLPCLSPIEESGIIRTDPFSEHVGISFAQLVKDKEEEKERYDIYKELEEFKIDDFTEEADNEDKSESQSSQTYDTVSKEVLAYGTRYLTGYDTLPELIYPDEVMELVPAGTLPDLLVLLPWGPFLKESFRSPAHYQVWLFGLVCYCQDTEVSKQATYLLLSELEKTTSSENYSPTPEDIINMFEDYGAVEAQEVIKLYEKPDPPTYLANIQNALKVYGCAVRDGENSDLQSTISVVRMIVRLCQDQHMTTSLDFVELSNILSNIFDGLSSFTSMEIDKISYMVAGEVRSMLVAPALCQVIRSGNPRCHLILEQVTMLLLAKHAGIQPVQEISKDMERPQLHDIITRIVDVCVDSRNWEEFTAMCTILDYHVSQAVLDKDQLSEAQSALRNLYSSINEKQEDRLSKVKTKILAIEALVLKRVQMGADALTTF